MRTGSPGLRNLGLFIISLFVAASAYAISDDAVKGMALGEAEDRVKAVGLAVVDADDATVAFIQAMANGCSWPAPTPPKARPPTR